MPVPYSVDLRERIVSAYANGEGSQQEIADKYEVSKVSVYRYWRQHELSGDVSPVLGAGGRPSRIDESGLEALKLLVEGQPDITLAELVKQYAGRKRANKVGKSVLQRALINLGFRRKKKSHYCIEQDRPDIKKSA